MAPTSVWHFARRRVFRYYAFLLNPVE